MYFYYKRHCGVDVNSEQALGNATLFPTEFHQGYPLTGTFWLLLHRFMTQFVTFMSELKLWTEMAQLTSSANNLPHRTRGVTPWVWHQSLNVRVFPCIKVHVLLIAINDAGIENGIKDFTLGRKKLPKTLFSF